jgi:hypothetical protein
MITVLVRAPEVCGQVSVVRITSANSAVLLVPSVIATMVVPRRSWLVPADPTQKIPAPGPVVVYCDVVPTQPR